MLDLSETGGRTSELASTCVHKASDHVTPLRPPVVRGLWSGFALALRDLHPYGNITLYEGLIACKHGYAALLSAKTLNPALFPDYTPRKDGLLTLRASKTLPVRTNRTSPDVAKCGAVARVALPAVAPSRRYLRGSPLRGVLWASHARQP